MGSAAGSTEFPVDLASLLTWLRHREGEIRSAGFLTRWYVFGSSLVDFQRARDIDVLVVYPDRLCVSSLRAALEEVCTTLPVELLLVSESEEEELSAIATQRAVPLAIGDVPSCGGE